MSQAGELVPGLITMAPEHNLREGGPNAGDLSHGEV